MNETAIKTPFNCIMNVSPSKQGHLQQSEYKIQIIMILTIDKHDYEEKENKINIEKVI